MLWKRTAPKLLANTPTLTLTLFSQVHYSDLRVVLLRVESWERSVVTEAAVLIFAPVLLPDQPALFLLRAFMLQRATGLSSRWRVPLLC